MFGGLELKRGGGGGGGGGSGDDDHRPPASVSAFGFLNAVDPVTADAAPNTGNSTANASLPSASRSSSSGFSFLNTAAAPAPEPARAALSGFSFLQDTTTAPTAAPETGATADSGFSFMIPSPDKTPAMTTIDGTESEGGGGGGRGASTSAFSFLSGTSFSIDEGDSYALPPLSSVKVPAVSIGSATSSVVTAPSPVPTMTTENAMDFSSAIPSTSMSTGPSGLPTGAGISFGTAGPKKVGVRKKKTRAQKIGMGTSGVGGPPPMQSMPPPSPMPRHQQEAEQHQHQPKPPSPKETRDAAVEAQRRAEDFMTRKTLAEATATTTPTPTRLSVNDNTSAAGMTIPTYDQSPPLQTSASNDEEVARAKRAAEEAQKMSAAGANGKEGRGGFMGTFFKGFGGSSNSSLPKGSTSGQAKRSSPTPSTTNAVDKLAKQQQEMKWAAAERQMQLQKQTMTQNDDDDDDEEVVVSTSVGGYQQPEVEPASVAPRGGKIETTATTSKSTFQPIAPVAPISNGASHTRLMVKELAPTPKKKKTPTQAFEEYQALFAQSVHRTIQQVEAVRSQQKMLSEERFVATAKQRLAVQQIQQTEVQLQVAVENEDYELADQLGQVIEAHNREKAEVALVLDSIAMGLQQLESQKALVVQGVATCFDNLALHIKELQEQENSKERDTSDSETFKQFEMISKQLSAEQERLNQDQKHLEKDEQLLAEERNELELAISEQSGEYERQRDGVKEKLDAVEEEIAELRRQLEAKSKIAAGLRTEMHGLEDNISRVRVKFSRQLTRVDKKERSLNENRLELETERTIFQRQKEAHELQVQSHSEALLAHDVLMKTLEDELKLCKEFAGMVSTKLGFMPMEAKSKRVEDAEAEGNLAQLQADVVKCEAACSEAKVLLKAAVATVSKLEAEHSMLIARVPQLEADKRAAAAKRDFKAASKASKEIKEAAARLKECEEELVGEAAEKKTAAEAELARLSAELDRTRKIAEEEEKVSGIARMEDLAQQIKNLVATKQELCGDVSSNQNTVKGVGAFVLDGQIKALNDEGQDLGSKYGCWNELIKDILCDECLAADEPESRTTGGEVSATETELAPPPAPASDGLTSEERIAKVRGLVKRIQEAENALEAAAEREDYEEAARLQDVFENLQMELENTNLTDEESEFAFADEDPTSVVASSEGEKTSAIETSEEVEHEEVDEAVIVTEETTPESSDDKTHHELPEDEVAVDCADPKDPPASEDAGEAADESDGTAENGTEVMEEALPEDEANPDEGPVENHSATDEATKTKESDEEDSSSDKAEPIAADIVDDPVETE